MDLVKYLTFYMIFFLLGIWGFFLNRKNILIMLMLIELMLFYVNLLN
jgi:NADH-quinone oxidoreductase subunit K